MDSGAMLNNVGAAITAGLGVMGLLRPSAAAAFTSMQPQGLTGVSEVRATYGGFFLVLGTYALYAQAPTAFLIVGLAWLGAAAGRLLSVVIDRSYAATNLGGVVFETVIGALLLAA
ncbi:MAG: DUF4345 family protein [Candidatus Binatia bacterium]